MLLAELPPLQALALLGAGALGATLLLRWIDRSRQGALATQSRQIIENGKREADALLREARLQASEEALRQREQAEKILNARQLEIQAQEQRVNHRESLVTQQLENLARQEKNLRDLQADLDRQKHNLALQQEEITHLLKTRREELQKISHLTESEARAFLMKDVERECHRDANDLARHILEQAKQNAEQQARRIVSLAIQRYAGAHTCETTTATIALSGDEIKGRIIGREGRNIRAFESATGITVLIDDTPNAVVLSGFDPVRREVAREAMERLILDGRIHPTRIEEVVAKVTEEMDDRIVKAGEEAIYQTGLPPMPVEIVKILGKLRFRQSFSQNLLHHSVEVAHLAGLLATEIGADTTTAKRAGLLHDIGKALNHETEGSHAIVGADFVKRHGESPEVVDGVASHHDEVPHVGIWGILVSAADAISASRPGARSETMTTYIKRLEDLERIGNSLDGVEKCFAVQAGRELRVFVRPDQISDDDATKLARNLCRRIENEMTYPGQIRITVIRETRVLEYAK